MATVTKHTRIFLGAGHHRNPRNAQTYIEQPALPDVSGRDPVNPLTLNAQSVFYQTDTQVLPTRFLFWGLSDGTYSRTDPGQTLVEPAGTNSLEIIEWHYLPGGGGGPGASYELIDAYDSLAGAFFDDVFVTVADPALNALQVNNDGAVPTATPESISALDTIPGHAFRFAQWVVDVANDHSVASGHGLAIPAGSDGFAIAAYDTPRPAHIPHLTLSEMEVIEILFGVINDAPGVGGKPGGPYGPIDPGWGSAIRDIANLAAVTLTSQRLSAAEGKEIRAAALGSLGKVGARIANFAKTGKSVR